MDFVLNLLIHTIDKCHGMWYWRCVRLVAYSCFYAY